MPIVTYAEGGETTDRAYAAWTKAHDDRRGFVINRKGNAYTLHIAGCNHFFALP